MTGSDELTQAQEKIKTLEATLARNKVLLAKTQERLYAIYTSNGWRVLARCYSLRDLLIPRGTRRRKALLTLFKSGLKLSAFLLKPGRRRKPRSINDDYEKWI